MPRLLIIKTSSLGDVVHNLPVVSDILRAHPQSEIDWVVEEAYADLPQLHRGVRRVIRVAQRRWRGSVSHAARDEKRAFEAQLHEQEYDVVLDTQGLVKSALLTRSARLRPGGMRVGFSRRLAREGLARLFYDRGYDVAPHLHAIERVRSLAGQALGYQPSGLPRFDIAAPDVCFAWLGARPYAVLLHATSRPEKAWNPALWRGLMDRFDAAGIDSVLLHGNERERQAALELSRDKAHAILAPRLRLADAAALIARARAVVGVDTGLTHLAAAFDVPTVALFGATARWRYAPYWTERAVSLGEEKRQPALNEVVTTLAGLGIALGP
jgi:heptosyltransferase-1